MFALTFKMSLMASGSSLTRQAILSSIGITGPLTSVPQRTTLSRRPEAIITTTTDIRKGVNMSNDSVRYVVPYSAPKIKRGELRIDADSPTNALIRAQEIHAHRVQLFRSGGFGSKSYYSPTMKLCKRERTQIVYGCL